MKKSYRTILIFLFLLCPCAAYSLETPDEFIDRLQVNIDSIKDWKADFTQKAYISSISQYDTSKGTVKIKKPGKILWEYLDPDPQLLVSDGKKMYIYSKADKQVIVKDMGPRALAGADLLFLAGEKKIKEIFDIEVMDDKKPGKNVAKLKMTPKTQRPNLLYLTLSINKKSLDIIAIQSFDPYENNTIVEFSSTKLNSKIPDKTFNFRIPKGVEVIDSSEMMK